MKDLTISIVNYKSANLVRDCINSILKFTHGITYEIIVIDNCSNDNIRNVVDEFEDVTLILNNKNLGFAAANNLALKQSKAKYFLLLNPDTFLLNNALNILFNFMENHTNCAVSCPQLYYPNGAKQQSYTNFRTPYNRIMWDINPLLDRLGIYSFIRYFKELFIKVPDLKINKPKQNQKSFNVVDRPRGACFFVRKSFIDLVGYMDDRFFMYCEEVDWALRFQKHGFLNYICYEAHVAHIWGGTSKDYSSILKLVQIQSEYKYFKKHFGFFGFFTIVFGNLFSSFLSLVLLFLNLFDSGERNKLVEKIKFHMKCSIIYLFKIKI